MQQIQLASYKVHFRSVEGNDDDYDCDCKSGLRLRSLYTRLIIQYS